MTDRPHPNDDALLAQRIRSGDREALGELYDRNVSVALATSLRVVGDRQQAGDLVHDAFVGVGQKLDRFHALPASLPDLQPPVSRNRRPIRASSASL